uniref:Uncharacterized protein n=1 Tax=Ditylenchus dipsaci TaxID=166011 RepID=A0A915E9I6_9BILA
MISIVSIQDYNDYSPTVQFTQAMLPLYNQQPAMPTNLPYNYLYPGPPPVPPTNPPPQAYTLPYASYRKPPTGVDSQQRELLSKIAEESENFNFPRHHKTTSPASTKEQAFQQLLSNFVTQLPKIAQSMVQIGVNGAGTGPAKENWISLTSTTISPTDQFRPIGSIEEVEETDQASSIGPMEQNIRQDGNAGSLINSMPEPATFLSFNKLLSSFAEGDRAKGQNEHEETIYDMSNVRGTPILKVGCSRLFGIKTNDKLLEVRAVHNGSCTEHGYIICENGEISTRG